MMTKKMDRTELFRAAMLHSAANGIPILKTKKAATLEEVLDEHIATVTKALEKQKASEKSTEEKLAELRGDLREMSQKMAQGRGAGGGFADAAPQTIGQQLTASDRYKSHVELADGDRPKHLNVSLKAIGSGSASAGGIASPAMRDEVVTMPRRRLTMRDLVSVVNTETGAVQFPTQTVRDNQAAPVTEGNLKPQSNYGWELKDVPIRTIAHWVEVNRQIMDDAPQLEGLIDQELIYGLDLVEDIEILYGDGTGEHLTGLAVGATSYSAPFTITNPTMIDQVGLALLQSALLDEEPDGVSVHPSDWMRIRLTKDGQGRYIYGDPALAVTPVIFGKPVVATKAMQIDKFLVGPFKRGGRLYDRMQTEIRISDQDRDNFVRNRLTIRGERRLGLGKRFPASFVYGDFGNVP